MSLPWHLKILAKIVLSRLPLRYGFWQRLRLFRAGEMDSPTYAFDVLAMHLDRTGLRGQQGFIVLELGPGDSVVTALFARASGAAAAILVDSHDNANQDITVLTRAAQLLRDKGITPPDLGSLTTTDQALARLNGQYLTGGLASLRTIPSASVDLVFSQAVMEHVRIADFPATLAEMRRILKHGGVASHWIDFRDHLQAGLNNLRFSHQVWESDFMVQSGFYTNRIPWPQMEAMIRAAGFAIETVDTTHWPGGLPMPQSAMAPPWCNMPEEALRVMTNWVLLRPA